MRTNGATSNSRFLPPTRRASRLSEPDRSPHDLAFSVVRWCHVEASTPRRRSPPRAPKDTSWRWSFDQPSDQDRFHSLPARGCCSHCPEHLWLVRLHLVGGGSCGCTTWSSHCLQPGHHVHHSSKARLVRDLGPRCSAIPRQRPRRNASAFEDLMPLTNLCNRLVVMRTRWALHSQVWGFHPSTRRDLPCCSTDTEVPAASQIVHDDVGWPLPVSPTPSSDTVWRRAASRHQGHRPWGGTRSPEQQLVSALVSLHEPGELAPDAPCRTPWVHRFPGFLEEDQNPFCRGCANTSVFQDSERLPPIGPVPHFSALAFGAVLRGPPLALWLGHQEPSFRHAFTLGSPNARLEHLPAIRRSLPGHMPPIDFCSRVFHEHTHDPPRLRRAPANRHANEWRCSPKETAPAELSQVRGRALVRPARNPRHGHRCTATDLPQPIRPGHLLSRADARHGSERGHAQRPCGYGLSRINPPSSPHLRTVRL